MLLAHFTDKRAASNIIDNGIQKFPFYLTTDLERGPTYGAYAAVFKVTKEFKCKLGTVVCNKKSSGMVQYVIRNQTELRSFLYAIEASGVRHCMHLKGVQ